MFKPHPSAFGAFRVPGRASGLTGRRRWRSMMVPKPTLKGPDQTALPIQHSLGAVGQVRQPLAGELENVA